MNIIASQLEQLGNALKAYDYNGFQYHSVVRQSDRDSYQFLFIENTELQKDYRYFILEVAHAVVANMKIQDVFSYIHNQVKNHPDLKRASHHQEFYKKFDEVLK